MWGSENGPLFLDAVLYPINFFLWMGGRFPPTPTYYRESEYEVRISKTLKEKYLLCSVPEVVVPSLLSKSL